MSGALSHGETGLPGTATQSPTPPVSRSASLQRGRAVTIGQRGPSPVSRTPTGGISRVSPSQDGSLEKPELQRKPSQYSHNRQTSIVNGVQHSRNTSYVNSPATSPLSPQVIAAAGAALSRIADGSTMAQDIVGELPMLQASPNTIMGGGPRHVGPTPSLSSERLLEHSPSHERRIERMQSGKSKQGHNHHRSQSRHHHHQQDSKTVGEFALHHLFNAFVGEANQKINQCFPDPNIPKPDIEPVCGPGVDPRFDQLITALGHISRQNPKPVIDSLMLWRKQKSEDAYALRSELQKKLMSTVGNGVTSRRNAAESTSTLVGRPSLGGTAKSPELQSLEQAVVQADRRSTASIYLLCRVLTEVIGQSDLASMTRELAEKLEDIIYTQLKTHDQESLEESPIKRTNWNMFGKVLGGLSEIDFDNVSDRYIADLEKMQKTLDGKGPASRETEGSMVMIIHSMKYLSVKSYPEDSWEKSCMYLQGIAGLFAGGHGQPVKYAYCQLIKEHLLPIAANATSELEQPKWRSIVDAFRSKLLGLLSKPKHWHEAWPAMCAALCAAPADLFDMQWLHLVLQLPARLKERASRSDALKSICRLVWTYLYRVNSDTQNMTVRKLEDVIRMVFQPGKRSYLSTDPSIADPLIQLIRSIGYKHQDLCFRQIIFPLLNSDTFLSGRNLTVDSLEPERMVIGIRAFLSIMSDLENGEEPPFPVHFGNDESSTRFDTTASAVSPRVVMQMASKFTTMKEDRLSRPVLFTGFGDVAKEAYIRFCKILGEITIICDNAFGGQAVLDEKFSGLTPKTPMSDAFSFTRRDDSQTFHDPRQGFYDLLHVAVQALPRCLSAHINFNSLVNLLCTGTAHVQSAIAASSAQSLKSIARQSHAQAVTIGFARFIFNFDNRYATMSDGGMLGPEHIESTLRLYVELLQIWIDQTKQRNQKTIADPLDDSTSDTRGAQLDFSSLWAHVDEVESHGLFFLCSPSRRVRSFAVTVLRLVTEFDNALGKDSQRVIRIMESSPRRVMDVNDEKLSLAERSRLQRGMRKSTVQGTLVELCSSDAHYDWTLWFKLFPNLIRTAFEICPVAVTLAREDICGRLTQMQKTIQNLADGSRQFHPAFDVSSPRSASRLATTSPDVAIEQWKLYLIFACTTLTNTATQQASPSPRSVQHIRKSSKSSQKGQGKVQSAPELFNLVLPLLQTANVTIREAVVIALGSININLYKSLLECMQVLVLQCNEEAKTRLVPHQRTASSPMRVRRLDHLRTEVAHVYKLTSHFLRSPQAYNNDWIMNNLVTYTKDIRLFLNDADVQNEVDYQRLRTHYCGLVEALYEGITKTADPLRWMPFQARKAAFTLMEDWCGYSPNHEQIRQRDATMRRSVLDREHELGANRATVTAAMEIEKKDLRTAALSAMATLCGGPLQIITDSKTNLSFDVARMLSWIDTIFNTQGDKLHAIGRRALKNLIMHNPDHPYLLGTSIDMCYVARDPKSLESYFEVVCQVLTENANLSPPFWKILGAGLYTLGNENNVLRMKSARLLRSLEERQQKNSKIQDLDISVSDKTIAVYKLAQFEISKRLASQHPELTFLVFSEFSRHFKGLEADHQRNMVAAMLPWVQSINLQLDPNGGPTAASYMLLANLFEITVRFGTALHNEIQALWQALSTGPHAGNVQLTLDFIINLCLERKEQNFVDYAKQIVVHLSSTQAGSKVIEFLLLQITPKSMVAEKRDFPSVPQDAAALPYLADMSHVLPIGNAKVGFSLGQLCMILLVDLFVSPVKLPADKVPLLLHVVLILWDFYLSLVQEQAREMLVHLIHELVISKLEDTPSGGEKASVEDFIESIRQRDPKTYWAYDDHSGKKEDEPGDRVPEAMTYVATKVLDTFSITYPNLHAEWGKVALTWATSCPVRHLACRSFQLFRCVSSTLDQRMLADMLIRLSNTISAEEPDILMFSMEILTTLKSVIDSLSSTELLQFPQIFWATCACLDTIHELEFTESIAILDRLLNKLDLSDPTVVDHLKDYYPEKWEGGFEGLQPLIYKGMRSSESMDQTLPLLEKLVDVPSSQLVGDHTRLAFTILANIPQFLRSFEGAQYRNHKILSSAETLAAVAEDQGCLHIARALNGYANVRYRSEKDFLAQLLSAIRTSFFPELEFKTLTFLISLLTNNAPWFKIQVTKILCAIIPEIDMKKAEIADKGPDLLSPVLRLLQTEFCPQALDVLDNVMTMTVTPMDKHHMRMSMAGSHSSRAFRKEFERTQSLYGIPEESGWSIPMPAIHASKTRINIHAVFYTCTAAATLDATETASPKIEFSGDDEQTASYFPDYRTATMASEETRNDGHIGELVMRLDSLDDFFDDDGPDNISITPSSPAFSMGSPTEAREHLYDQQTLPILHKSLTRNPSVTSLQTGFADFKTAAREPDVMTPMAFAVSPGPTSAPLRPGLHTRSITSPVVNQRSPNGMALSGDENDSSVSDDEAMGMTRTQSNDKAFFLESMIRPITQGTKSGFRSGMRRLTGGGDAKEKERAREALRAEKSPQVPKVPEVYLRNPRSADP